MCCQNAAPNGSETKVGGRVTPKRGTKWPRNAGKETWRSRRLSTRKPRTGGTSHWIVRRSTAPTAGHKSISTNGANRPTRRPCVRSVWRCHRLSKRSAKTKQITSQTWARLDVSGGGPLLWHASIPTDALHRISMTVRSSRNCLQATGHAFHCLSWSEQGTRGWPNDSGRLQTGLFGVALPLKLQKKGDPARRPRDALRDLKL